MTSRERMIAALEFSSPDRAPRDLWALPYVSLFRGEELRELVTRFPPDLAGTQLSPGTANLRVNHLETVGEYVDEWGSLWDKAEPGVIGEVKRPALDDWSKLDGYQPPWETIDLIDRDHINRQCAEGDRFRMSAVTARPFERLQFIRGSENLFLDLAYDTAEVRRLLEMVHDYYRRMIRAWCETDVDAVMMMDDWGSSRSLLISPAMWRAVFKPLYAEYCRMIHDAGKYVFFHSDGHIAAIYGDLIEVGVQALNSQLFCMDIEALADQYRGQVTFWGEIDRQSILPFGTPDEVRAAVARVRAALDDGRGGVIAQCEWGSKDPAENIAAVYEAWEG